MKGNYAEDSEDQYEDSQEELAQDSGFDLRDKSLKNTAKKAPLERKQTLPMKAIMSQILDKPVGQSGIVVDLYLTYRNLLHSRRRKLLSRM